MVNYGGDFDVLRWREIDGRFEKALPLMKRAISSVINSDGG